MPDCTPELTPEMVLTSCLLASAGAASRRAPSLLRPSLAERWAATGTCFARLTTAPTASPGVETMALPISMARPLIEPKILDRSFAKACCTVVARRAGDATTRSTVSCAAVVARSFASSAAFPTASLTAPAARPGAALTASPTRLTEATTASPAAPAAPAAALPTRPGTALMAPTVASLAASAARTGARWKSETTLSVLNSTLLNASSDFDCMAAEALSAAEAAAALAAFAASSGTCCSFATVAFTAAAGI
mmetsp:Transcript_11855/g.32005  ORF Transcript_11855/g.32005 Transcript_11855/m.32005 type:complete len:251 (-) Transcript_11855:492-1244(-)